MSDSSLTPDELKRQHATEIAKSETFETHGVSKQLALNYLETPEGEKYFQHLRNAAPNASLETITDRAIEQITSGRELPRMEVINEPLVKLIPAGTKISSSSPYFIKLSELERVLASGQSLSEAFGLPLSARYNVYQITPKAPIEVFINHVAPVSEMSAPVNSRFFANLIKRAYGLLRPIKKEVKQ